MNEMNNAGKLTGELKAEWVMMLEMKTAGQGKKDKWILISEQKAKNERNLSLNWMTAGRH